MIPGCTGCWAVYISVFSVGINM